MSDPFCKRINPEPLGARWRDASSASRGSVGRASTSEGPRRAPSEPASSRSRSKMSCFARSTTERWPAGGGGGGGAASVWARAAGLRGAAGGAGSGQARTAACEEGDERPQELHGDGPPGAARAELGHEDVRQVERHAQPVESVLRLPRAGAARAAGSISAGEAGRAERGKRRQPARRGARAPAGHVSGRRAARGGCVGL